MNVEDSSILSTSELSGMNSQLTDVGICSGIFHAPSFVLQERLLDLILFLLIYLLPGAELSVSSGHAAGTSFPLELNPSRP